jgi:hypothetical protein
VKLYNPFSPDVPVEALLATPRIADFHAACDARPAQGRPMLVCSVLGAAIGVEEKPLRGRLTMPQGGL